MNQVFVKDHIVGTETKNIPGTIPSQDFETQILSFGASIIEYGSFLRSGSSDAINVSNEDFLSQVKTATDYNQLSINEDGSYKILTISGTKINNILVINSGHDYYFYATNKMLLKTTTT